MSKYVQYNLKNITNLECLLAALAEMGYDSGSVEIHDKPVTLYGYHGDARPERAEVVIRRANVGSSANDIGFAKQADGTYTPIVSEYDSAWTAKGKRGGGLFVDTLQAAYGKVAGNKAIRTLTDITIPRMKAQGIVPRHATVATVKKGTATQLVLRY